jgi:hypothetical protein
VRLQLDQLLRVLRDERGMALVEWLALTGVALALTLTIWLAAFGAPGRALRDTVQGVATRYALGFESGVRTRGPSGRVPLVPGQRVVFEATPFAALAFDPTLRQEVRFDPTTNQPSPFDPTPFQIGAFVPAAQEPVAFAAVPNQAVETAPTFAQPVQFDPTTGQPVAFERVSYAATVFNVRRTEQVVVRPVAGVGVQFVAGSHQVRLVDPLTQQTVLFRPDTGEAIVVDPVTGRTAPVTLSKLVAWQMVTVSYETTQHSPILTLLRPVLIVPTLLGP